MTSNFTPLDSTTHRQHGWARPTDYRFAASDATVPVLLSELGHAVGAFPLAFNAVGEGGSSYQLVALQGLSTGRNAFLDANARWLAPYIPSHYRAFPFTLLQVQADGKILYMLGFDQSSGLYREAPNAQAKEQRFFDDEGGLQPWMQPLSNFLVESAKDRALTQQAVAALAAAKVLVPWEITLPAGPAAATAATVPAPLTGLHRVSPEALGRLPANVLEMLRDAKALDLAYAQMLSMPRMALLQHLQAQSQTVVQTQNQAATISPPADSPRADQMTPAQLEELLKLDWMK